jgi:hypothetical protein
MTRRNFILSSLAAISVVSISTYYFVSDIGYDATLAQPQDLSLIWDSQKISDIGNLYRKNIPGESSARSLVKLLDPAPTNEIIINDFKKGNTVLVDGWILSATEARQCALASTIQSR